MKKGDILEDRNAKFEEAKNALQEIIQGVFARSFVNWNQSDKEKGFQEFIDTFKVLQNQWGGNQQICEAFEIDGLSTEQYKEMSNLILDTLQNNKTALLNLDPVLETRQPEPVLKKSVLETIQEETKEELEVLKEKDELNTMDPLKILEELEELREKGELSTGDYLKILKELEEESQEKDELSTIDKLNLFEKGNLGEVNKHKQKIKIYKPDSDFKPSEKGTVYSERLGSSGPFKKLVNVRQMARKFEKEQVQTPSSTLLKPRQIFLAGGKLQNFQDNLKGGSREV